MTINLYTTILSYIHILRLSKEIYIHCMKVKFYLWQVCVSMFVIFDATATTEAIHELQNQSYVIGHVY